MTLRRSMITQKSMAVSALLTRTLGCSHAKRYLLDFDAFTGGAEILLAFCCAYRYAGVMDVRSDIFQGTPDGFHPRDVSVRLARPDERIRWDRLMDQHHYLGFKRIAGRGIRYVFDWRGQWVWPCRAGSQVPSSAALVTNGSAGSENSSSPRMHLIANNMLIGIQR